MLMNTIDCNEATYLYLVESSDNSDLSISSSLEVMDSSKIFRPVPTSARTSLQSFLQNPSSPPARQGHLAFGGGGSWRQALLLGACPTVAF